MNKSKIYQCLAIAGLSLIYGACKMPAATQRAENANTPLAYATGGQDSTNSAKLGYKDLFKDQYLIALIDTALKNNQELNITLQEIEISKNDIKARKGEYLPFIGVKAGAGLDKVARYTSRGAMEANTEIRPGKEMPDPLPDFVISAYASWEVDIWHKLRNAKKAAVMKYLASQEGRNFMVTHVVAEIADSYYELLALDNQLQILKQSIDIQNSALRIVRVQKEATKVTELAVQRFEAQVSKTRSLQFDIQQQITETENRLNLLLGRFPQPIQRNAETFENMDLMPLQAGLPSQLLANRPDIRQAEFELAASKLDVKVAKAKFYPQLDISASVGYQAFNPAYLFTTPASLLYTVAGELVAPVINRNAIKAEYSSANAKQLQAVYEYERKILSAYVEVANQLSNIGNLQKSYDLRKDQVRALTRSVGISNTLFSSTRADYAEVLLTQREALEARFDLIDTKKEQINARINVYQALGGGWR